MDDCSMRLSCRGGDAGGVAGSPPGEHSGMCLLGIAVGVPREEVLSDRCGGGVEERPSIEGYLATAAAMLTSPRPGVEMERRRVTWQVLCSSNGPSQSERCSGGVRRLPEHSRSDRSSLSGN